MQEQPNLSYVKELAGKDIEFEKKFIAILKEEFPKEYDSYVQFMTLNKLEKAAQIVHKLKHKFNILSMTNAYRFAVDYEEDLNKYRPKKDLDFRKTLDIIKNYLNTI